MVQGYICTQLAMNMCDSDIKRGICGVMGAILAIKEAAWGLAVGLILHLLLKDTVKQKNNRQRITSNADHPPDVKPF